MPLCICIYSNVPIGMFCISIFTGWELDRDMPYRVRLYVSNVYVCMGRNMCDWECIYGKSWERLRSFVVLYYYVHSCCIVTMQCFFLLGCIFIVFCSSYSFLLLRLKQNKAMYRNISYHTSCIQQHGKWCHSQGGHDSSIFTNIEWLPYGRLFYR